MLRSILKAYFDGIETRGRIFRWGEKQCLPWRWSTSNASLVELILSLEASIL